MREYKVQIYWVFMKYKKDDKVIIMSRPTDSKFVAKYDAYIGRVGVVKSVHDFKDLKDLPCYYLISDDFLYRAYYWDENLIPYSKVAKTLYAR